MNSPFNDQLFPKHMEQNLMERLGQLAAEFNKHSAMKIPDTTVDFPFDFNFIPLKFQPNLWDANQRVPLRGLRFFFLYIISFGVGLALIFVPIALFTGTFKAPFLMWGIASFLGGGGIGLLSWWTFCREERKLKASRESTEE